MKLTQEQSQKLQNFADYNNYQLRDNYSGRTMYGSNCIGFVCYNTHRLVMELMLFLSDEGEVKLANTMIGSVFYDSMGFSTDSIVYFQNVQSDVKDNDADE